MNSKFIYYQNKVDPLQPIVPPPVPEVSGWHHPFFNKLPVKLSVAVIAASGLTWCPQPIEVVTVDKWMQPLSLPTPKLALPNYKQQTTAFVEADPFPEAVRVDKWGRPFSDPVRRKKKPPESALVFAPTVTITADRWLNPLSGPVRRKPRPLDSALAFVPVVAEAEVITVDKWFNPLVEPVRSKSLPAALQQSLAFVKDDLSVGTAASIVYEASAVSSAIVNTGSSYTFPLTVAAAGGAERLIAVGGIGGTAALVDFTAVTCDGQAATRVGTVSRGADDGSTVCSFLTFYLAPGTANTSVDVVATYAGGTCFGGYCAVWTLTGDPALLDTTNAAVNDPDLSTDTATGGAVAAALLGYNASGASTAWTGLTEDFDGLNNFGNDLFTGSSDDIVSGATPRAISANVTPDLSLSIASICVSFGSGGGEVITVDKWFRPLSEPVRVRSVKQGDQVFVPVFTGGEVVTVDKWFSQLGDPARRRSLPASDQQFLAFVKADPFPETTSVDRWGQPFSTPNRRLRAVQGDAEVFVPAPSAEIVTVDKWYAAFTPPVRRSGLSASRQQTLALGPFPITASVSSWWSPLSVPVRRRGLPASEQQTLALGPFPITVTVAWWSPLSEPVRRRGFPSYGQQDDAFIWPVPAETVTVDKWYRDLGVPTRRRPAVLSPATFQSNYLVPAPYVDPPMASWSYSWSLPVRLRTGLLAADQSASVIPIIPQPNPPQPTGVYTVSGLYVIDQFTNNTVVYDYGGGVSHRTN